MHSWLLRVRVQKYRQKKKQQIAANVTLPDASPFQTRQSTRKSMRPALKSALCVIAKMAIEAALEIRGTLGKNVSKKSLANYSRLLFKGWNIMTSTRSKRSGHIMRGY